MKERSDFVTNSSSTSYCIVGVGPDFLGIDSECSYEEAEKMEDKGLSVGRVSDWIGCIGNSISSMQDDETLLQFKERTCTLLREAFPEMDIRPENLSIVTDGGYDG